MTRKDARITAFKLLYQLDVQKETPEEILNTYYLTHELNNEGAKEYIERIVYGVYARMDEINKVIGKYSVDRKVDRLSKVVGASTRLAVFELIYCADIPGVVAVNEAVAITKEYESEESAGFVNGLLANVLKEYR